MLLIPSRFFILFLFLPVMLCITCTTAQRPASGPLPPAVAPVETALPAFIGYTESARQTQPDDLRMLPRKIASMQAYERFFGAPPREAGLAVRIDETRDAAGQTTNMDIQADFQNDRSPFWMYHALQAFFANGGAECYIVSVGGYEDGGIDRARLTRGLAAVDTIDEVTLLALPDAPGLPSAADYASVQQQALSQCARRGDRFAIMEVWQNPDLAFTGDNVTVFRSTIGSNDLSYGAAYYPYLATTLDFAYRDEDVSVVHRINGVEGGPLQGRLDRLAMENPAFYNQAATALDQLPVVLAPSAMMAGIYARTDRDRGVWKAPANVSPAGVIGPVRPIDDALQQNLTVDPVGGKSINAIRTFPGKGTLVWGARTLAGNDNEWRYIPVRRHAIMLEESVRKGTAFAATEPNDRDTWQRVKTVVENFLLQQWRAGALQGAKPEQAFFVKAGLGETMMVRDIEQGRLVIELGFAPLKPAEFLLLRIVQPMDTP